MDNKILIILGMVLLILIILNHVTIVTTNPNQTNSQSSQSSKSASCSQTAFGCCPDGVNSKINYYGTNCPPYNPGPGYSTNPPPPSQ